MIPYFNCKKSKLFFTFILTSALLTTAFSNSNPIDIKTDVPKGFKSQQNTVIRFTENKGQVHDQNYQTRSDVLYSVMTGNMAVHIKNSGVSYQLYKVNKYKDIVDERTKKTRKEIEEQTIYRVDVNWLNTNRNFTHAEEDVLPGYNNYYLENCTNGALNVKSYKGIILYNLYNGINLHYYEKDGELKHDYIVAAHSDYKQIQLKIEGADFYLKEDGALILNTPLGKIQEAAPKVFQNGKELIARWVIKSTRFKDAGLINNKLTVCFEIENYDSNYELIIDPVTRIWGTYYGGAGDEYGNSSCTDVSGNVYLSGRTESNTDIATTGSHMSIHGALIDAYVIKFNSNGVRLWGTYYGGSGDDVVNSSVCDTSGNIYLAGVSTSASGIATAASHQFTFSGNADAFLIKFNANGTRLWGTYYGDLGTDNGYSCATDVLGNVFLAGFTNSNSGTAFSSLASHQPIYGGGNEDAFLAKFDSNGNRLWGTYYGGTDMDKAFGCATDSLGNLYVTGSTGSGTDIATINSHQPALIFGGDNAFLVKFNTNGVRQWGTYYGGDIGFSCAVDNFGNVFIAGVTAFDAGPLTASLGSHQSIFGGNNANDAFLAKFDSNGVRNWGTFYGGIGNDIGYSCTSDLLGNVYLAGTTSSGANTVIATLNSHQPILAGIENAFLVKFNNNGIRQWGTYYGGIFGEEGNCCTSDGFGHIYLAGISASYSGISTFGSHQPTLAASGSGATDAFLVKFDVCEGAPFVPKSIIGTSNPCLGVASNFSAPNVFGANYFTWSLPAGWSGSSTNNTISATPGTSGIFTVTAGNACGTSPQQTLNVTVNALPTITVSSTSTLLCAGESATLTASGALTYSFYTVGTGSSITISPSITTIYSVSGIDVNSCKNTAIITQYVDECLGITHNYQNILSGIEIYPNPTKGAININVDSEAELTFLNSLGQIICFKKLYIGMNTLNLEAIKGGLYILSITKAQATKCFKVIKE